MGKRRFLTISVGVLALFILPAQFLNYKIERKVQAIVADDRNDLALPLQFESVGLRTKRRWNGSGTSCEGFCLHALLTGTAKKVLITNTKDFSKPISFEDEAIEYSLQRRDVCPTVKFTLGHHRLELPFDRSSGKRAANAIQDMKLRMSDGECLVATPATLGEADVVLTRARMVQGPHYASRLRFSITKDTETVDRLAVHVVDQANGTFDEVYRWTGVQYFNFTGGFIPSPLFGYGLEINMGWLRKKRRLNISRKHYEHPNWVGFLTKTLGLDLVLDGEVSRDNIRTAIEWIVQAGHAPTRAEWDMISTYFDGVGIGRNTKLQRADYLLAVNMIKNPAFPTPKRLYSIVAFANAHENLMAKKELADLLLTRLESGQTWGDDANVKFSRDVAQVAGSLANFPADVLEAQFDRIERLSDDPFMQEHGYNLLRHMHVFGAKSLPVLMKLMEIGVDGEIKGNRYQHPFLAGIGGVCMLGPVAQVALPRIQELMTSERIPSHGSYGKLLMNTLINLSADSELIWPLWERRYKNTTREKFEKYLARADAGSSWNCSY